MKQLGRLLRPAWAAVLFSIGMQGWAQTPAARLSGPVVGSGNVVLTGSRSPRALPANDIGALSTSTPVSGITLVFNRSATQEAALQALLAAQQNPASPQYRQWLTPETFGAQFGVAASDIASVESWLQSQGFTINKLSRAHDRVTFSGTAGQVNTAFNTSLHQYRSGSTVNYAPSTDLSLPSALAPMVTAVLHVSTFRPHPMVKRAPAGVTPAYTTANSEEHFLTPKDVATMYDVNSVYNSGYTGSGQTIAIAGETYIPTSDVADFQTAVGLPANLPTLVLEPGTGISATYSGDEFESDIDTEYSTGMATGANVLLVYVGDSPNYSVFDALNYIIEDDIAPVASISYGECEPLLGSSSAAAGNATFEQAAAQGQTVIASAGDEGSTECFGYTDDEGNPLPAATQEQLAINYPADSPYVTALGGTQMQAGTFAAGSSSYWAGATTSPVVNSLLSYVPETVWNEDSTNFGFASGSGGASIYFQAPSYQTGVVGIPAGNAVRLNPDISLQSSVDSPGYLACSSDPSAFLADQTNSCTNGIYDSTGKYVTQAGGTSFAAPIFAGLMAILNQAKHTTGQGLVNSNLYSLYASAPSAFHDITTGNNDCSALPSDCSAGLTEYQATAGYDEATGLGSIDFANLVAAWPNSAAGLLAASTVALSPATLTPASGATDVVTITVSSSNSGGVTPTGTVAITVDGTAATTVTLSNGQATYTYPGTAVGGSHVITANYSGDANYASSTSTVSLTLAGTSIPSGSFTFTAGPISVPVNSYGTSNIVVTGAGGYNGVINFTIPSLPASDCYAIETYPAITSSAPLTIELAIGNGTECTTDADVRIGNQLVPWVKRAANDAAPKLPWRGKPLTSMLAGLLAVGLVARRRNRRLPMLLSFALLTMVAGLSLSGCGGSAAPVTSPTTPPATSTGATTLTLVGTDSVVASITSSASFTLTVTQ